MGMEMISVPLAATICPQRRWATRSTAPMPKRVESTRSVAVGAPPRWMWPRMVLRVSMPVISSISRVTHSPMPPRRGRPDASTPASASGSSWPSGTKPSATTTSGERPRSWTCCTHSATWDIGVRTSGMRIAWAPAAMPECRAIQPTWRPMTSATMQRWWDSPVVRSRSMASVAICTAVSKPNV